MSSTFSNEVLQYLRNVFHVLFRCMIFNKVQYFDNTTTSLLWYFHTWQCKTTKCKKKYYHYDCFHVIFHDFGGLFSPNSWQFRRFIFVEERLCTQAVWKPVFEMASSVDAFQQFFRIAAAVSLDLKWNLSLWKQTNVFYKKKLPGAFHC